MELKTSLRKVKMSITVSRDRRTMTEGGISHAGRELPDATVEYECGGAHRWEVT